MRIVYYIVMEKRGQKPKGKVKIKWSPNFAYAVGLLVTDGNLSSDGYHINFTSKDLELITNFLGGLQINCHVGRKASGSNTEKKYYVVQFGDVLFYKFLTSIGLTPNKTKIIGALKIPHQYFFDFLRGHFDGDGSFYSYWDKRWRSSFMHYVQFVSASKKHVFWLRAELLEKTGCVGHISESKNSSVYQLRYAKRESFKIIRKMYPTKNSTCLSRKRLKIEKALRIIGKKL